MAANQPDEEDEPLFQNPGIWATYSAGGKTVSRRDPDIAFVWRDASPLQQLPPGPFQVIWKGKLLIRSPGKYRFHANLQGEVAATINGQKVLTANQDANAQWVTGPEVEFEFGEMPFEIVFKSTAPQSRIKLHWSSDSFAFEPIPTGAYFMQEAHPEYESESRGRELFAAHRCNRCHRRDNDPLSPAGPDLSHVATGLQAEWLERWLTGNSKETPHRSMPEFAFSKEETQAVAAFLRSQSTEVALQAAMFASKDPKTMEAGRTLFHTTGCLACHSYGSLQGESRLGGGDLSTVGDKRSWEWLRLWLTDPQKLNADHRMPVFKWNRTDKQDELEEIVSFLANSKSVAAPAGPAAAKEAPAQQLVEQGRQLVEKARCAACHRLNRVPAVVPTDLTNLELGDTESAKSCLQKTPDRANWRPAYPETDYAAIKAYLKQRAGKLTPEGPVEQGQRLLAWNNCLQCHPRDGVRGLAAQTAALTKLFPDLASQSPTLVPPDLNAVGDKLQDQALLSAVGGDIVSPRMPWLQVRMPKFGHTPDERKILAQFFIGHDRILSPPLELVPRPETPQSDQRPLARVAGHALLGSQGFSCIACHQVGSYTPRDVALGTRGSDLLQIGQRMRREYFFRWTRSPIRIIPDMEMPGYERPIADVLDGKIDTQLGALWEALHDPNASKPVDALRVQQSFAVKPGEPARIVRDVFYIPKAIKREDFYIPRTFAVGLNSQHNILFDLDRMSVRGWWYGELARQRTEGKSWNWNAAGVRFVYEQLNGQTDIAFLRSDGPNSSLLHSFRPLGIRVKRSDGSSTDTDKPHSAADYYEVGTVGDLVEYSNVNNGVRIVYRLYVPQSAQNSEPLPVTVTEEWQPLSASDQAPQHGWSRKITIPVDSKVRPVLMRPEHWVLFREPSPDTSEVKLQGGLQWQRKLPGTTVNEFYARLQPDGQGNVSVTLHYTATEKPTLPGGPTILSQISPKTVISTVPGYSATRLPIPNSIMPTALTWTKNGTLAFASLKGHVYTAHDTDGDGLEDKLTVFEEGLAAPYGLISDPADGSLIVSQKPELLRLIDTDGDGRADLRKVFSTGWGYNDNYHDWTCGIVRDSKGNLYVGLGSDYTQKKRPPDQQRWRGKILRIDPSGKPAPIASGFRYPTGLAMTPEDDLFVTDNQGEQNLFNELNHIVEGGRYGVPSREDPLSELPASTPAIQIPHPWTRSINGIFFIPRDAKLAADKPEPHPFAGHGIGCEYDTRFLIRFTLQKVGDTFQGAVYPFSLEKVPPTQANFEGTLCGGVSPKGDIYIGCIHDSGWLGGLNVGSLVKLQSTGTLPPGIRELQATPQGFQIDFTAPMNREAASAVASYTISAYTRKWQGTYATPDSNRHEVKVSSVTVSDDGRRVLLRTDPLLAGYVYEVTCGKIGPDPKVALWPATGHYTVNRVPVEK